VTFENDFGNSDGLGLFSGETIDGGCETYDASFEFNPADKIGRAFGILANLLLVFAFVCTFLMIFVLKEKAARMVWMVARILFVLALHSVIITFVGVAKDICIACESGAKCKLGAAGIVNAINVFVLYGIVSTVWCTPIPDEPVIKCGGPRRNNQDNQASSKSPTLAAAPQVTKTKTIEILPHGRKITEVVLHPDGSKTVTETIEEEDGYEA